MINNYKFTYIIGYKHSPDRLINLLRVLDWLYPFSGIEIIIVEQDTTPRLNHRDLRAKYFFIESKLPYNRSWGFNVGLKEATTNLIVFGDSDLIMDPQKLIAAVNELVNYDAVNPYTKVIDLKPEESNLAIGDILSINRVGRGEADNQKTNFSGGIVCMTKDAAMRIGGWPENFISWGGEDNLVSEKIFRFLTHKQMDANCYHLWHNPTVPDYTFYQKNLQMLNEFVKMPNDQMLAYINSTIASIGLKSRFQYEV